MRLLGCILIAISALRLGFSASEGLRRRVQVLEELCAGLRRMEQELELSAPELGELMQRISRVSRGESRAFFAGFGAALSRLGERSAGELWRECVEEMSDLSKEGKGLLSALGDCLGRFDAREQRVCVAAVRERMEQLREREGAACREKCKLCHALTLSGGAFLVILLL